MITKRSLPSAEVTALLDDVCAMIYRDPAYAEHDWSLIALVYNFKDARENTYGYVFRPDGSWSAETPDDPEYAILDKMLALQAAMAEAGTGAKWHRALLHINTEAQMNVQFEYNDPDRWTIKPSDLDASVEALRPS